jgi:2-polyprenyl-6-methoxyphenol hydroxylase-like FAD-dependent oxidoreductase
MLARQGRRVVVFERFEQAAPVGAGFMLQPTGLAVLDDLGLTAGVEAMAQPIDHIFGREARRGRVVLDIRYADLHRPRPALGVHRAALFDVLHRACLEAGVGFETGREITAAGAGRLTDARGVSSPAFALVVDASGARSPIAAALARHRRLNDALADYARARRWHIRLYQALSLGFTPFYQADGRVRPWVRDHLLGKVSRLPLSPRLLAATVSGLLLDPRPR